MPSTRIIYDWQFGFSTAKIYAPEMGKNFRLDAVAFGGLGGGGEDHPNQPGGGGGGAGAYFSGSLDIVPNSMLRISPLLQGGIRGMSLQWYSFSPTLEVATPADPDRNMILMSGVPGADAAGGVAGVGGQSGNGCIGGVASNAPWPECFVDGNNLAHSTGGWCGSDLSTATVAFPEFAVEKGSQIFRNLKHVGLGRISQTRYGGKGGCSFFGAGGGYGSNIAGFGGGGCGSNFPLQHYKPGDAFVKLSWEWANET